MERLAISYINELNSFHAWLLTNQLSSSARLLWYTLMHTCNSTGWKAEFNVAMSVLEMDTGLSKKTIERARNALQQAGRITFTSRKGSQSAVYSIIPFVSHSDAQSVPQNTANSFVGHDDAQSVPQNTANSFVGHDDAQSVPQCVPQCVPQPVPQSVPIPRLEKTRGEETAAAAARAKLENPDFKEAIRVFQNNIHPVANEVEKEDLLALLADYGPEWVIMAIKEAARSHAGSIRYVEAILKRWKVTGSTAPWNEKRTKTPADSQQTPEEKEKEAAAARFLEKVRQRREAANVPKEVRPDAVE